MNTDFDTEIIFNPDKPKLSELMDEYMLINPSINGLTSMVEGDNIRFNKWENQDASCRKISANGFEAKPWEGASDQRVFLADDVINEHVALCVNSFWRAMLSLEGTEVGDLGKGPVATKAIQWFVKNKQEAELQREVQLSAQYMDQYGWTVLHPSWKRKVSLRMMEIDAEDLDPASQLMALDPQYEGPAIEVFQQLYADYVAQNISGVWEGEIPKVSKKTIRKALEDLRSERGKAKVPIPYVQENRPSIIALKPWEEVLISTDNGDINRCRVYVRRFMREEELWEKVAMEGWDRAWVEKAVAHKGKYSYWSWMGNTAVSSNLTQGYNLLENGNPTQIEVIYTYSQRLNSDLVPGIYETVWHSCVGGRSSSGDEDLVGHHGLCDFKHGLNPFVLGAREWIARSVLASRGVPEIAFPSQRVVKTQQDALIDKANTETSPPVLVPPRYMEMKIEFGPQSKVPMLPGNDRPALWPTTPQTAVAVDVMKREEGWVDRYFGRLNPEQPPPTAYAKQQLMVNNFLAMWKQAYAQEWALICQYVDEKDFMAITGAPKPVQNEASAITAEHDLMLNFDVRQMDMDHTLKELEIIQKAILPVDAAGVIDRVKLVQAALAAINPVLAKQLVSDQTAASQRIYKDVQNDLNSMFLGNMPMPVENDPTAPRKMQYAQQIIGTNPMFQQALQQDGLFRKNLETYAKNLMMSAAQEKNKVVGRIGVDPADTAAA